MAQAVAGRIARGERELQREDLVFEFMLNALRLTGGVDIALFERTTGLESSALESALEQAAARGLIEPVRGGRIVTTSLGNRFLNDLQAMFLP